MEDKVWNFGRVYIYLYTVVGSPDHLCWTSRAIKLLTSTAIILGAPILIDPLHKSPWQKHINTFLWL